VLLMAAWFGLMAGLVEGITANFLRGIPGFVVRVSPEILWIAPAFNSVLFLCLGLGFAGVSLLAPNLLNIRVWIGLLSGMTLFGVALLIGQLHQTAALLLSVGVAVQTARLLRRRENHLLAWAPSVVGSMAAVVLLVGAAGAQWDRWRERNLVAALPAAPVSKPNVFLIVLDTVRADHLSSYGYKRPTTPNIDRLAAQGVVFEYAFANSSWTLPAHASLLTGRLPFEHKADWWDPLDETFPTLAEAMAKGGYRTAAFSANTSYVAPDWGLARGFTRFETYGSSLIDNIVRTVYGRKLAVNLLPRLGYFDIPGRKRASRVNEEFFSWLDGVDGRPFFALLNYLDAHDPYLTVDSYQSNFSSAVTRGDVLNFQFQPHSHRRKPVLSESEIEMEINGYDGCLAYLDAQIGLLLAGLGERGLRENTLVIVTSDHGESFGNHDLFGHGNSLYLETLHVPLVFSWPGEIPAGVRVSNVVSLHRIPSTIMQLLNRENALFPGEPLVKLWSGAGDDVTAEPILAEVSPGRFKAGPLNYPTSSGGLKSLISDRWHFILSESGRVELYDWRADRSERYNLAHTPEGRALVDDFKRHLDRILGKTRPVES
jgi:arylsulfatase A-like enzyme